MRVNGEQPWLETDRRPEGVDDATVEAMGKLGEAVERVERARGRLYDFHQMCGHSDLLLGEAADKLEDAGHVELAEWPRRPGTPCLTVGTMCSSRR